MHLVEQSRIEGNRLPVTAFRNHLRLGTGFADETAQDAIVVATLRGAIAEVEGICAKALLMRGFTMTLGTWIDASRQTLPRAPLVSVQELRILAPDGTSQSVNRDRYHVDGVGDRPSIAARGFALPRIPAGGRAEIAFTAGWETWDDVPADLALATLSLAAARYEDRTGTDAIPRGVRATLSAYRQPRLGRGL